MSFQITDIWASVVPVCLTTDCKNIWTTIPSGISSNGKRPIWDPDPCSFRVLDCSTDVIGCRVRTGVKPTDDVGRMGNAPQSLTINKAKETSLLQNRKRTKCYMHNFLLIWIKSFNLSTHTLLYKEHAIFKMREDMQSVSMTTESSWWSDQFSWYIYFGQIKSFIWSNPKGFYKEWKGVLCVFAPLLLNCEV
jgi:hypothetical protein